LTNRESHGFQAFIVMGAVGFDCEI